MEELLKKVLYTGVGLISATTERVQKSVDELIQQGKLSREEGRKVVDDIVKNTESKREEYEKRFRKLIDSAVSTVTADQEDEHAKLEKRIKSLEVKLGLLAKQVQKQKSEKN